MCSQPVARGTLAEVYDWFTEGFDTADLREAKALRAIGVTRVNPSTIRDTALSANSSISAYNPLLG
jgi:hypothetical protein